MDINNEKYEEKFVRFINYLIYLNIKKQLYENWRGSNYFYCNGRCVLGPLTFRPILMTSLIIITPTILLLSYEFEVSSNKINKIYN